jgi:hypothetical protein
MSYFKYPCNLPSPLASMEGVGNIGMSMPLSTTEVAYNIVQQDLTKPDLTPPQEIDPVLELIWTQ